jgi:hypothetical protein
MAHDRRALTVWLLPLLVLCLACALTGLASQMMAARLTRPVANVTPICAWLRHGRAGLWWSTSVAPGRALARSPRSKSLCLTIPWAEALPNGGRIAVRVTP